MQEQMAKELLHFDPLTILVLIVGFTTTWVTLKKDSKWHTSWIKRHDDECKEFKKNQTNIITALQVSNAHLSTLVESNAERLNRADDEIVRVRDRVHELGNDINRGHGRI